MSTSMNVAVFGPSLLSPHLNPTVAYFRGLLRAMHRRGHRITYYEPLAFDRQSHHDLDSVDYAKVVPFHASLNSVRTVLDKARGADVVMKAGEAGVFDSYLDEELLEFQGRHATVVYWDLDPAATLATLERDPEDLVAALIPEYDLVLTAGGGPTLEARYRECGARAFRRIHPAFDPDGVGGTAAVAGFQADLSLYLNARPTYRDLLRQWIYEPASRMPDKGFLLGGEGWDDPPKTLPNVRMTGALPPARRGGFFASAGAVLSLSLDREDEAFSPSPCFFDAAGIGRCLLVEERPGLDEWLLPAEACLPVRDGVALVDALSELTADRARAIGAAAADHVRRHHTYDHRAVELDEALQAVHGG